MSIQGGKKNKNPTIEERLINFQRGSANQNAGLEEGGGDDGD